MSEAGFENLLQIAKVLKSNGTDGGLLIGCRDILPEEIDQEEPVFIEFDGLPVPFFILDLSKRGSQKAIVHLNDITSLKYAEEVVGKEIYADASLYEDIDADADLSALVGWTLKGVGQISDYIDIPGNPCIEVEGKLIPLNEDFIVSIDENQRIIEMNLPEGLLDV